MIVLYTIPFLTAEARVGASSDDAEESPSVGRVTLDSPDLDLMVDHGNGQHQGAVGIRFPGLEVPPGATIQRAHVRFTIDEAEDEATHLTVRAEAADDAATYTTASFDISTRPRTLASVSWEPALWCCPGTTEESADLAPLVQEVVDRPGWASGNALALVFTGDGSRTAKSWDRAPDVAPVLHVEYVPAGAVAGLRERPGVRLEARISPHPIAGRGRLRLVLPRAGAARADLFDVRGRRVRTLLDAERLAAGSHEVVIGPGLESGIYFYHVTAGDERVSGRCVVLR